MQHLTRFWPLIEHISIYPICKRLERNDSLCFQTIERSAIKKPCTIFRCLGTRSWSMTIQRPQPNRMFKNYKKKKIIDMERFKSNSVLTSNLIIIGFLNECKQFHSVYLAKPSAMMKNPFGCCFIL